MDEIAGLDDPGGGSFRSTFNNIDLSQHEQFEREQAKLSFRTMKDFEKVKRARRHRSKKNKNEILNNTRDGERSRSRTASSSGDSVVNSDIDSQNDTQLPLGQTVPNPTLTSSSLSPPEHLVTVPPTQSETQTPTSPFTPIGREKYSERDPGPYIVHVQRIEVSPDAGTVLHPVAFGFFLQKRQREFPNIIDGSVKRIGRNRVSINFHSANDANSFLDSPTLIQHKYKASVPSFNVTRMGLVRGIPSEWSPEEILENIQVPSNSGGARPVKARRLNYKKNNPDGTYCWLPAQTVVITFDGQVLPTRIFMCLNSLPVEQYELPTIQCFRCCRFGHTKEKCRSTPRCFRCGNSHTGDSCSVDTQESYCCNCPQGLGSGHFANSKTCPEYNRQLSIKKTMTSENLSYVEASNHHPKVIRKSYANVTASSPEVSTSYKKTIFRSPRSPPPSRKGYDRIAHNAFTKNPVINSGPAFPDKPFEQSNEIIINELIKILSSLVKVFSPASPLADSSLLSHVAPFISSLLLSSNNGSSCNSVEQPQYQQ